MPSVAREYGLRQTDRPGSSSAGRRGTCSRFCRRLTIFLIPLGYLCLAAVLLRESMPDVEIKLIDCPVQKMGWGSLEALMREWQPDMVCAGDEAIYVHETAKLFRTAKRANPECITVGGGFTLPHVPEWALGPGASDFLVFGEGELTFAELVKTLRYGGDLNQVKGLRFLGKGGEVVDTGFRPLIHDLDSLPLPAYDLMPRISHRKGASLFQNSFNIEKGGAASTRAASAPSGPRWGAGRMVSLDPGTA